MIPALNTWNIDAHKLPTMDESDQILSSLHDKAKTSKCALGNLILYRLLSAAGLRISEALKITLDCVRLDCQMPHIVIPKTVGKGGKGRCVPIWSAQAVAELRQYKAMRQNTMNAKGSDVFFVSLSNGRSYGKPLTRQTAGTRYKTIIKSALSKERSTELSCHSSRHFWVSCAIARGVSLVEVQKAAGHSSLQTTTIYSHLFVDRNAKTYNID